MLPPGALFRARAFAFLPCAPKSHLHPLPHLGPSESAGRDLIDLFFFCASLGAEVPVISDLLETTLKHALKFGKCDLVMDTPFVDTPFF